MSDFVSRVLMTERAVPAIALVGMTFEYVCIIRLVNINEDTPLLHKIQ